MFEQVLLVLVTAALPISELRGAIPLAIGGFGFDPLSAYLLGVVGNLFPVAVLLKLLEPATTLVRRVLVLDRAVTWLFARTRTRHRARIERWGAVALVLFVAIPLPATGAWTAVIIAHVFGIPFRYAFPSIALGVGIAGVLVTLATLGVLHLGF